MEGLPGGSPGEGWQARLRRGRSREAESQERCSASEGREDDQTACSMARLEGLCRTGTMRRKWTV